MLVILLISLLVIMLLTKPNTAKWSWHCFIRNAYILYAIVYTVHGGGYFWLVWLGLLPVEFGLHLLNLSNIIPFYSSRNRTKDCYRMFAKIGKIEPQLSDYMAEGYHLNQVDHMQTEQEKKFDWVISEGGISSNTHVLEIGSGHGKMATYIQQKTNCYYVCNTLSPEQHKDLLDKGKNSILGDILTTDMQKYYHFFDIILFNGPIEHLGSAGICFETSQKHDIYRRLFLKLEYLMNPQSHLKRIIVASCIHLRRPIKSLKHFFLFPFLLDLCYGGNYPQAPFGLINHKTPTTKLIKMIDATESYYLYSLWYRALLNKKSKQILKLFLTDIGEIVNNPAWFYWIFSNWAEQFAKIDNGSPFMQNLWIVLEGHTKNQAEKLAQSSRTDENGDFLGAYAVMPLGEKFPRATLGVNIDKDLVESVTL